MRYLHSSLVAFCCLAAFFAFSAPLLAQNTFYPGSTETINGSVTSLGGGDTSVPASKWTVSSASNSYDANTPGGWSAAPSGVGTGITVTASATAPPGQYTVSCITHSAYNSSNDYWTYSGPKATFQVVAVPPTLPPAGTPAFSWQGTVAGVNTGNGNKTTALPIVGWTMRGGMAVSCALYHNSQGASYGGCGNKWTPSYFSFISGGSSAPVLHWDNGLTYAYTLNNGTYFPPVGILDTLTYSGGTWTLTTPNQTVYTFGYSPGNSYLSKITDLDGNTLSIGHNSDTTISTVTDSTSRTLTYAYSGGQLVSIEDPLARFWYFTYGTADGTSSSNLWYVTLPTLNDGHTYGIYFGYDSNSNITAMQSPQGHVIGATSTFGYDASSSPRLIWAKDPIGNKTTFTYNASSTVITNPNGHTTTHFYTNSQLTKITDALNYSTSTTYDYNNIPSKTVDKRGNPSTFSSHFSNNSSTSKSTDAMNYVTTSTVDGKNKVTQSVDGVGNTTANVYSADGKEDLTSTSVTGTGSAPFQATSRISGYTNGLPTTFTTPLGYANGYSSSVTYDNNGYVNGTTDENGHSSSAVSNILGWQTSTTDANKNTTTYTPDNWGRITDIMAMDGTHTKTTYDADGNVLTVMDADNHTVTNTYDADNRLTQTKNGRGDVVKYTYDGPNGYGSVDRNGVTQYGLLSSKNRRQRLRYHLRLHRPQRAVPDRLRRRHQRELLLRRQR